MITYISKVVEELIIIKIKKSMNTQELILKYENKLLELLEIQLKNDGTEMTQSDFQGALMAQVSMLIQEARASISRSDWEKIGFINDWGLIR